MQHYNCTLMEILTNLNPQGKVTGAPVATCKAQCCNSVKAARVSGTIFLEFKNLVVQNDTSGVCTHNNEIRVQLSETRRVVIIVCTGIWISRCKILSSWRIKQCETLNRDTKVTVSVCLLQNKSFIRFGCKLITLCFNQVALFYTLEYIRSQNFHFNI